MMGDWTFFSNHGHVLVCLVRNRRARLRDVAQEVGITERAVQKIVRDLQDDGYLTVSKQGRCNRYRINRRKSLRHGLVSHCTVGKLLSVVVPPEAVEAGVEPAASLAEPAAQSSEDMTVPAAAMAAAPASAPKPEPEPKSGADRPRKKKAAEKSAKRDAPVDTRLQGSLF